MELATKAEPATTMATELEPSSRYLGVGAGGDNFVTRTVALGAAAHSAPTPTSGLVLRPNKTSFESVCNVKPVIVNPTDKECVIAIMQIEKSLDATILYYVNSSPFGLCGLRLRALWSITMACEIGEVQTPRAADLGCHAFLLEFLKLVRGNNVVHTSCCMRGNAGKVAAYAGPKQLQERMHRAYDDDMGDAPVAVFDAFLDDFAGLCPGDSPRMSPQLAAIAESTSRELL
ncbi:hypothetical protein HPB49_015398 [Dermacentor silvarum]|uniref:Uncharacterized protein n=1 Tax=Dermacentor silvarum TaxID=543639 RepID=A0ACB8CRY3_DERSI|nr:hypothetical protein HPB49_015398 [Dermacentor silvarum]